MDKLIGMLDTIIQETSDDDVEWRLTKAYVLDDLDKPHEAKAIFQQILRRAPSNAHALQGLATVMHKLGEDDVMLKMVEELLQKAVEQKSVEEAYNMKLVLAHVYIVQDNLEEALKQYQHLIDENSKDFRPYLCQGIIYSVLGKKDKAEELFEKYLSFVPDSFSRHDFLNEIMLKVQTEAGKLSEERKKQEKRLTEGKTPEEGKRPERTMEQPKLGG
uniref:Uncharacterized protein n=1 Tax=Araucaria cunninghamii TaxID=56994 RepID=A0A0D6R4F8_ARACU